MSRRSKPAACHPPGQRWVVWLAVWLTLFAVLAPWVSQALARDEAPLGAEICTTTGPQTIVLPGAGDAAEPAKSPTPAGDHLLAHCPFCLLHADRLALPAQALRLHPPVTRGVRVTPFTCTVAAPTPPYNSAAPRGPPAHA